MGYEISRFPYGSVDEELICPICSGVLESAVQAPNCEHAFCSQCISEWLRHQANCPVDRLPITQLQPVPRITKNLLARLDIRCDNEDFGCRLIVKLDVLHHHLKDCDFNPHKPVCCSEGCGLTFPKDLMKNHNCIKELRILFRNSDSKVESLQIELKECKYQLSELRRDVNTLKDLVRNVRFNHRTVTDQIQDDEILQWSNSLPTARVTRWGGMISTPDTLLQDEIKISLGQLNCPSHILNELMENSHEHRWPAGLLTLETRQMNRRQYEQYVCKRIPNKQSVIVLACDNMHMSDDMILRPGLVMMFAHGIE